MIATSKISIGRLKGQCCQIEESIEEFGGSVVFSQKEVGGVVVKKREEEM
jgi:hypothetical protein